MRNNASAISPYNKKGFADAKVKLRKLGYCNVISPRDLPGIGDPDIESDYMKVIKRDIIVMLEKTDWVILIEGWEKSRGANLEIAVAKLLDIPVFKLEQLQWHEDEDFKIKHDNYVNSPSRM